MSVGKVVECAYEVLHGFEQVKESSDAMRAITLDDGESEALFAPEGPQDADAVEDAPSEAFVDA